MHIGWQLWLWTPILFCEQGHSTILVKNQYQTRKVVLYDVMIILPCFYWSTSFPAQTLAEARYDALLRTTPELLISGSDDHTLFLWSPFPSSSPLSSGQHSITKPVARLTGHQRQISHVAFSPDGRWAASAAWDNSVRIWEGRTGKFIATLRGHVGAVYRLAWSADGRMLISASKDSTLKVPSLSLSWWCSSPFLTFFDDLDLGFEDV